MSSLEQAYARFYQVFADHIRKNSPTLKSIAVDDGGVQINDIQASEQLQGCYVKLTTSSTTNDAWMTLVAHTEHSEFEVVVSQAGLGWQEIVLWFPQWNHEDWETQSSWFETKPRCEWGSRVIKFAKIPKNAERFEMLGRSFYRDRSYGEVYFVDSSNVIICYWLERQ